MTDPMTIRLKNHNWAITLRDGYDRAIDDLKADSEIKDHHVIFALLKEAARVSRIAYPAPPRLGLPTSSSMPDAPDDVTQWQLISAYLAGTLTSIPSIENRPPRPTAREVDRCDLMLYLWHTYALARKGDRSRLKRAVYMKANGVKPAKIKAVSGLSPQQVLRAQVDACEDIQSAIDRFYKK